MTMQKPDLATLLAFLFVVIIGGSNAVAVRFSNLVLDPFWGAAMRFSATALIFWALIAVLRIPVPRGRSLLGAVLFGLLTVGLSYAFMYWGLLRVQASLSMVILALTPLLTFLLAIAHGLERFRWRGLAGALIAFSGILIGVRGALGAQIPLASLLAIMAGAACMAEGNVLYKRFPKSHPVATNAIAVATGAVFLLGLSIFRGETWVLPQTSQATIAVAYLILIGSVVLFYLYLYVLSRWTASATTYSFLLFPIVTVLMGAWLAGEAVTPAFLLGGLLVVAGVWMGAVRAAHSPPPVEEKPAAENLA